MDTSDQKSIALLTENTRLSITKISEAVHLSHPSVTKPIEWLIENGIIKRFTII